MNTAVRPDLRRKIPVLATLSSLGYMGAGAAGLVQFAMLHVRTQNSPPNLYTGQSAIYIALSLVGDACLILGGALLWKMKPRSLHVLAFGWIISEVASAFYRLNSVRVLPWTARVELQLICLLSLVYVRWVTRRWEASRPAHTLEA